VRPCRSEVLVPVTNGVTLVKDRRDASVLARLAQLCVRRLAVTTGMNAGDEHDISRFGRHRDPLDAGRASQDQAGLAAAGRQ
jgi:hypothetical protein